MNEDMLRERIRAVQDKYGTPATFISQRIGVTREHFSRWLNDSNYVISEKLLSKISKLEILKMNEMNLVSIPADEYERLLDKSNFLDCLESQGVDNWTGYGYAHEEYEEEYGKRFY